MSNLSAFFAQAVVAVEPVKHIVSDRFKDSDGSPIPWEIKAISSEEDEAIRKACTRQVQVPGKKGQCTTETDFNKYVGKLAASCVVFPDLNSAELQDSYKAMGADVLLKKMLLPGEYATLLEKTQQICGFDKTMEEKVEEAKNS